MRETKARTSGLPIFIAAIAVALALAMLGALRAEDRTTDASVNSPSEGDSSVNSSRAESSSDRNLIELNKVLVIPQKCTANDGMMNCDPNETPPADANAPSGSNATKAGEDSNSNSNNSADADSPDNTNPPNAADAESASEPEDEDNGSGAVANAAPSSSAAEPSPSEPDISNPDTPLPGASAQGNPAVASNDPNAITPQYGSLEDYQSQEDAAMVAIPVPVPMYAGAVYGAGIPYPNYVNPVGGTYAAARVYTPTYRPPFGPAGPWMTPPSVMFGRAPGLAPAPMARPAGRVFGFHR